MGVHHANELTGSVVFIRDQPLRCFVRVSLLVINPNGSHTVRSVIPDQRQVSSIAACDVSHLASGLIPGVRDGRAGVVNQRRHTNGEAQTKISGERACAQSCACRIPIGCGGTVLHTRCSDVAPVTRNAKYVGDSLRYIAYTVGTICKRKQPRAAVRADLGSVRWGWRERQKCTIGGDHEDFLIEDLDMHIHARDPPRAQSSSQLVRRISISVDDQRQDARDVDVLSEIDHVARRHIDRLSIEANLAAAGDL